MTNTAHPYTATTLNKAAREALKAALAAHPGWTDYRTGRYTASGAALHTGNATRDELLQACWTLSIDVLGIIADANTTGPTDDLGPFATDPTMIPMVQALTDATQGEGFEGRSPADLTAEALAPIAPMSAILAPSLYAALQDGVSALAAAAARGPRTIREVETVTVYADGSAPEPVEIIPAPKHLQDVRARALFGLQSDAGGETWRRILTDVRVALYDGNGGAPDTDPHYVWTPELAAAFAACAAQGSHLWLAGPAGTGKSEAARQFAALGSRHFVRIAINRTTEPADLLGQYLPKPGGGFMWRDGPLTRAFRIPGCVVLIDEPTFLRPGSLAVFQTALDFGEVHLNSGEVVKKAANVLIVAADNTAGAGDDTGRYADTAAMSLALIDRFALMVSVDYLPEAREAALLRDRAGVPLPVARHMVGYANATRANFEGGKLTAGLTFRRLFAWASMARLGMPSRTAFTMAIVTPADPTDRETLRQLEATQGGHDRIDATLAGASWESTAPAPAPSAVGAMFPDNNG
jgi:MoxR-like ATPase